jgi:hypothetical protein
MKKVFLFTTMLFIVCAANAQTEFTAPTPTPEQKYNLARAWWYNTLLTSISVAKAEGITVEEFSKKSGEKYAAIWNAETGFNQFTNNMLFYMSCVSDSINIVEQSEVKVVFISSPIYPPLANQGILFGTSLEEVVSCFDLIYSEIANRFNLKCNVTLVDGGLHFEISQ